MANWRSCERLYPFVQTYSTYEQEKMIRISAHEQARLRAEARAKAVIAEGEARSKAAIAEGEARAKAAIVESEARADAMIVRAEARVKELLAEHYQRLQELACRMPTMVFTPTLSDWENIVAEQIDRPLPPPVGPDLFRKVVSVIAYYKAEQRGFGPGQETDDWLEAERELLAFSTLYR